jgi:aldose 1-epimerase
MFKVTREHHEGIQFVILFNTRSGEYAYLAPGIGANVYRIGLAFDKEVTEVLTPEPLPTLRVNPYYRGHILFPFNDRIYQGKYCHLGRSYQLEKNCKEDGSALHGLVFDKQFSLVDANDDDTRAEAVLRYSIEEGRFSGYPFPVTLTLTCRLRERQFDILFHITNDGQETIPLAFGWHPYFSFNNDIRNAEILCDSERYVEVEENLYPTGNIPLTRNSRFDFRYFRKFGGIDLDTGFTAPGSGKTVLRKGNKHILVEQDTSVFKYTWLFTPPDHNSIAIEPVTSGTDSFNRDDMGKIELPAGKEIRTWISVSAETLG